MTGRACEGALAFQIAGGLAQPVSGAGKLKPVVGHASRPPVKMKNVVFQRLSRTIRENASTKTYEVGRKPQAGGFKMALHADFHPPIGRKPRGVDNGASHTRSRQPLCDCLNVSFSGTVTALAIDSFRHPIRKERGSFPVVGSRLELRIAIMAEHTFIRNFAAESGMIGSVICRTHCPETPLFRVPRERKLHQFPRFGTAEITPSVLSGPEPIVDLRLQNVDDGSVEPALALLEVWPAVSHIDAEEFFRSGMVKSASLWLADLGLLPNKMAQ
jgi:hypothetical protein